MSTIVNTEACAAGVIVNLGSPASHDNVGAQTVVAYCKPTASGESGLGYLLSKATAAHWLRFIVDHNGGAPRLNFGADSSGAAGNPSAVTNNSTITYNVEQHFAATWDGSLNKTGIVLYNESGSMTIRADVGTNGSGTINSDAAGDLILFNRNSTNRAFVGDDYYVARWNRVLTWTELQNVFANGPLEEPTGLILCFANQQDYSSLALSVSSRSTHVDGGMPSNTALGEGDATVASATGTGAGAGSGGSASAGGSGNADGGTGTGTGAGTGGAPVVNLTTILSPEDRGNISLANSSVLNAETPTPTLLIVPRTMINDWVPGHPLQFHWYGAAANVNGKTPQFKVKFWTSTTHNDSTNIILQATAFPFNIAGGYAPEWSYTPYGPWTKFNHCLYDADNLHLRFYNDAPFAQNTVYYSTSIPWQEALTGEWLATLPTTYIQPTASVTAYGGAPYVFGQSAARVNELGETIDACNLYAFKISSGSGLAPNGQPKKKILLTSGNHPGEDPGNWALKGCIQELISASAWGETARAWLDFICCPNLNPPGRRGGEWRGTWDPAHLTYDANRHWLDGTLAVIEQFKTAILADTGGAVAGGISFHSSFPSADLRTYTDPSGEMAAWETPITTYVGPAYVPYLLNNPVTLNGWTMSVLGARVAFTPECDASPADDLEAYGAGFAKALSDMAATNYFSYGAVTAQAGTGTGVGAGSGGVATGTADATVPPATGSGSGAGSGGTATGETGGSATASGGTGSGTGSGTGGTATGQIAASVPPATGSGTGSGTGGTATGASSDATAAGGTGSGTGSGSGGSAAGQGTVVAGGLGPDLNVIYAMLATPITSVAGDFLGFIDSADVDVLDYARAGTHALRYLDVTALATDTLVSGEGQTYRVVGKPRRINTREYIADLVVP